MKVRTSTTLSEFKQGIEALQDAAQGSSGEIITPYKLMESTSELAGSLEEIAEMSLPVLLDEGRNHLRYWELYEKATKTEVDKELVQEKLRALAGSRYLQYLRNDLPQGFGFITYPAHVMHAPRDLIGTFPGNANQYWPYAYPIVYEMEGMRAADGRPVPGWISFSYIRPPQMKDQRSLMLNKIAESIRAVEALNCSLSGLGGLTASLSHGGRDLQDLVGASVTTGHSYTIANITNTMAIAAKTVNLPLEQAVVAVVGAAGSVGSGIARLCADYPIKELLLVDKRSTDDTAAKIRERSSVPLRGSDDVHIVREADIVLVATSASNALFGPDDFKPGAIVLDDSQPKNIPKSLLKERDDVLFLEAGVVRLPEAHKVKYRRAFGPRISGFTWSGAKLPMADAQEVPCCLAEVMIWKDQAAQQTEYSTGKADPEISRKLNAVGEKLGYSPGSLQCFGRPTKPETIERVTRIHGER